MRRCGGSSRTRICAASGGTTSSCCQTASRSRSSRAAIRLQLADVLHVQGTAAGAERGEDRFDRVVRQLRGEQDQSDPKVDVMWGDQTWEEMQYTGILLSPNRELGDWQIGRLRESGNLPIQASGRIGTSSLYAVSFDATTSPPFGSNATPTSDWPDTISSVLPSGRTRYRPFHPASASTHTALPASRRRSPAAARSPNTPCRSRPSRDRSDTRDRTVPASAPRLHAVVGTDRKMKCRHARRQRRDRGDRSIGLHREDRA